MSHPYIGVHLFYFIFRIVSRVGFYDRRTKTTNIHTPQKGADICRDCREAFSSAQHGQNLLLAQWTDTEMQKPQQNRGFMGFCKMCGKALEQKSKSRPKVFCSDKCRSAWWTENNSQLNRSALLPLKCENCGAEFACYPSQRKRFCSHACYINYRYHKGDRHENIDC